jgi:AhpD family alkylhydroperoxidase
MAARIRYQRVAPGAGRAMQGLEQYVKESGLDSNLLDLVRVRASQINGCAFCLDMHWKDLRARGVSEEQIYMLDAWREADIYSERERAALAWAEAVTLVAQDHVPDAVYEQARAQFSEEELVNLTMCIVAINGWNRLNVAFRTPSGIYQPRKE